jgi:predicted DNA-binding protein YlxM (UPF0122 family)
MEKDLRVSLYLDFYKNLLTEKQADSIDLYFNQDLSLGEISGHLGITRQGVRDSIKRGEKVLFNSEAKLGLAERFREIHGQIIEIENVVREIEAINIRKLYSSELDSGIKFIKNTLNDIKEKF